MERIPISVDTRKACVAKAALSAGADIINDISAGRYDSEMFQVCSLFSLLPCHGSQVVLETRAPIVMMHSRGTPENMSDLGTYNGSVIAPVANELKEQIRAALRIVRMINMQSVGLTVNRGSIHGRLSSTRALDSPRRCHTVLSYSVTCRRGRRLSVVMHALSERQTKDSWERSRSSPMPTTERGAQVRGLFSSS